LPESNDTEDFKQRTKAFIELSRKKLTQVYAAYNESGMEGVKHWAKTQHQIDDFKAALDELIIDSESDDFLLLQVDTTFSSFIVSEEDKGQAEWYKAAHQYITLFEDKLNQENHFDIKTLKLAVKELNFISQANHFHQKYGLEAIQKKVTKMYQSLQQSIKEFQANEKERLAHASEQEKTKAAELAAEKAKADAKTAMLESVKVKEKRLAISEEKKKRLAEKELLIEQDKQRELEVERQAKLAEQERQAKLQDSYLELQVEEKLSHLSLSELIQKMTDKLDNEILNEEQTQRLIVFIDYLKSKS
jgi:hypothetical protein